MLPFSFLPLARAARLAVLPALLVAMPQLAHAHAVLVSSNPKSNAVIHADALHVDLKFNSRIDGARCALSLVTADGQSRPLQMAAQAAPNELSAEAAGLHKGLYSLRWQALAADGHITRGAIPFRVE